MIRTDGERGRARQEVRAGGITGSVGICAGHTTWPGVLTPLAWLTALREKDPVTGMELQNAPQMLLMESATSSRVGLSPAPPKAFEMATFPSTAIMGRISMEGPSSES